MHDPTDFIPAKIGKVKRRLNSNSERNEGKIKSDKITRKPVSHTESESVGDECLHFLKVNPKRNEYNARIIRIGLHKCINSSQAFYVSVNCNNNLDQIIYFLEKGHRRLGKKT